MDMGNFRLYKVVRFPYLCLSKVLGDVLGPVKVMMHFGEQPIAISQLLTSRW